MHGARGRTRTVTISLSVDFESTASTISPLGHLLVYHTQLYFKNQCSLYRILRICSIKLDILVYNKLLYEPMYI